MNKTQGDQIRFKKTLVLSCCKRIQKFAKIKQEKKTITVAVVCVWGMIGIGAMTNRTKKEATLYKDIRIRVRDKGAKRDAGQISQKYGNI